MQRALRETRDRNLQSHLKAVVQRGEAFLVEQERRREVSYDSFVNSVLHMWIRLQVARKMLRFFSKSQIVFWWAMELSLAFRISSHIATRFSAHITFFVRSASCFPTTVLRREISSFIDSYISGKRYCTYIHVSLHHIEALRFPKYGEFLRKSSFSFLFDFLGVLVRTKCAIFSYKM